MFFVDLSQELLYHLYMNIDNLKEIDIFKNLSSDNLEKILSISNVQEFDKDNILFYEEDKAKYFYALLKGGVKIYKLDSNDNEIVIHNFTKSTLIAEMARLENVLYPANAIITQNNTKIISIKQEDFIVLLKENAQISFSMIHSLNKKIESLQSTINRNLVLSTTAKICSYLQEYPNALNQHPHKEIANILNMAPETLSRVISKLKKLNILGDDKKIINKELLDDLLF